MKKYISKELKEFISKPLFDERVILNKDPNFPKISIVTPSYNQAQFLERTILSVLNQNYPNLEYIIIDGGSTDGSLGIIKKYEKYLTYWVSEKDKGQTDAINKGIKVSTGEIVGWQNSDDIYFPNVFQLVGKKLRVNSNADILSGTVVNINENDEIIRISKFNKPTFYRLLYEGFIMSSQGVFWLRSVHDKVGYFNLNLHHAMDYDFWLKVLKKENSIFLPQVLGGYRVYANTKTSKFSYRGTREVNLIREKYGIKNGTLKHTIIKSMLRFIRLLQWYIVYRWHIKRG